MKKLVLTLALALAAFAVLNEHEMAVVAYCINKGTPERKPGRPRGSKNKPKLAQETWEVSE